jgi:excisionase family DNA binding protein
MPSVTGDRLGSPFTAEVGMQQIDERLLLKRQEAALLLGVSVDTVARLIEVGELRAIRIGRSVLVPRGELIALVERRQAATRESANAAA